MSGDGDDLFGGARFLAISAHTGSFAIGLGPVFWLLISEIYPLTIRGAAMSVATIANWAANFVVTISFLSIKNAIGGMGYFSCSVPSRWSLCSISGARYRKPRAGPCKSLSRSLPGER
jgi:Sugar (and other) transporter